MEKRKPSSEERRETGSAMMVIGWVLVLFALLVMYFRPAGVRLGATGCGGIAGTLVFVGMVLNIAGARVRHRNS